MSNTLPNGRWTKCHYMKRRRELMQKVQPDQRCHKCRKKAPSWQALEFDHLDGRTWEMNKVGSDQRIRVMEREHRDGVRLAGACRTCNAKDGAQRAYTYSRAKWSKPQRIRRTIRDIELKHYQDDAIRAFNTRWLMAGELYGEVLGLLESRAAA